MVIKPYNEAMADAWDAFVYESASGTLLHTRRFLSYHGDRFIDRSLVIYDEKQRIMALFPAALMPSDDTVVISHPGITYGGVLSGGRCRGEVMVQLLRAISNYYSSYGLTHLLYKVVPHFYHSLPAQDDLYALFRVDARRYRCDLSATIDLQNRGRIGSRRRRGFNKARKAGVIVASGAEYAAPLWEVLCSNLVKHNAKPVHTLDDILLLHDSFPDEICFSVALLGRKVEAGVVLFHTPMVTHVQYIASSKVGYDVNALDLLFEHCIYEAETNGRRYFDLGISNEDDGRVLNEGLYTFKSDFGAGGYVHEFYELDLGRKHGT